MIYIIDFGSQTTHLIGRRVRDFGVRPEIVLPKEALSLIKKNKPKGIILSGGPSSVYGEKALLVDKKIFSLGIPILGICYGLEVVGHLLGGKVASGKKKEYGRIEYKTKIPVSNPIFELRDLKLALEKKTQETFIGYIVITGFTKIPFASDSFLNVFQVEGLIK